VENPTQRSFGWIDITVVRNGWGRQVESFEAIADDGETPLMFIRAPRITRIGEDVETVITLNNEPVMVREGTITGATFHPELTTYRGIHAKVFGTSKG
jgi:5'-phosphate synthase pdxT subunit